MKKPSMVLALGVVALAMTGCSALLDEAPVPTSTVAANTSEQEEAAESDASETEATFVDGVLTTPEVKIVITDHRVIQPGEPGNEYGAKPVIAFWYEITNLSDKEVDPMEWIFLISAFQDNNPNAVNELGVGSLPDDRFLDTQMETIKKGGTVENAMAYELDDLTTPVDLVASDLLGATEYGKVTYQLQ